MTSCSSSWAMGVGQAMATRRCLGVHCRASSRDHASAPGACRIGRGEFGRWEKRGTQLGRELPRKRELPQQWRTIVHRG